jgi:hypothetical protein
MILRTSAERGPELSNTLSVARDATPRAAIAQFKQGLLGQSSMQRTFRLTFGSCEVSRPGAKLVKFGLKRLVDKQQGLYRASHVVVTGGDNLIDNSVGTI